MNISGSFCLTPLIALLKNLSFKAYKLSCQLKYIGNSNNALFTMPFIWLIMPFLKESRLHPSHLIFFH